MGSSPILHDGNHPGPGKEGDEGYHEGHDEDFPESIITNEPYVPGVRRVRKEIEQFEGTKSFTKKDD